MFSSATKSTLVVVLCALIHTTIAMDCKEVWSRKDEIKDCCKVDFMDHSALDGCMAKYQDKDKREKFACGFQCFMESQGLLDANNEPDKEKMLAKANEIEGNMKQVITTAIEECFAKHEKMKAKHAGKEHKGECNPSSGMMNMCIGMKMIKNCPAENFTDSELCNKVKSGECRPKGKGGKGGPGGPGGEDEGEE